MKNIRLFVLGVPEGWLVALFDIRKQQWIETTGWLHESLKEAKTHAEEQATVLVGKKPPEFNWH